MGNWTGLGDTLVDCDCKCCLNYAMAAIEANNFNSLSSVAVVKTKQKNKRIETTVLYTPFFCCYKSMHNEYFPGQSECSSCNALRGMGSVHINYSWKWSFTWLQPSLRLHLIKLGTRKKKKKTYAVQVDSCSCSRRQVDNKL